MEMWSAALFDHLKVVGFSPLGESPGLYPFLCFLKRLLGEGWNTSNLCTPAKVTDLPVDFTSILCSIVSS